jgi:hypothetical protein
MGTVTCFDIPQFDSAVVAGTGKGFAVGMKGNIPDPTCMVLEGETALMRLWIPEFDGAIEASAGEGVTVGTKGDRLTRRIIQKTSLTIIFERH